MSTTLAFHNNFLSFGQYAQASLRYTFKAKPATYILLLPLLAVSLFWFRLATDNALRASVMAKPTDYTMVLILSVLVVLIPFSTWRGLRKNYTSVRFMQAPADYEFSDAGMQLKSPFQQADMSWENFSSFYDLGRYGLLTTSTMTGFFLDFTALQAPARRTEFMALLASHKVTAK